MFDGSTQEIRRHVAAAIVFAGEVVECAGNVLIAQGKRLIQDAGRVEKANKRAQSKKT